jgi:RHS repeat-associated protein
VSVTAVNPGSTQGVVTLAPDASSQTVTSLVYGGSTLTGSVSNTAIIAVGDDGKIKAQAQTGIDLQLDVQGYYTAGNTAAGGYVSVNPTRILDTTNGTGVAQAQLTNGSDTTIQVSGTAGVPANASAVFVTFQATSTAAGYLVAYDTGNTPPTTSLNYPGGVTTAIGATVPLSSSGQLTVHVTGGSPIDLQADITGYFTAATTTGAFTPAAKRVYDSTVAPGVSLAANATATVQVAGVNGIPAAGTGITAVAVNVHTTHAGNTAGGFARVWASDAPEPSTSSIDYAPSSVRSNLISTAISANGFISIHNVSNFTLNYKIDLEGWYTSLNQVVAASQTRTQERITIQGNSPSTAGWVTYKYRVGTTGSFTKVPVADVVTPGTTTHPSAWPVARNTSNGNGVGTFDAYTWDLGATVHHGDQLVQVEGCYGVSNTDPSPLCTMPSDVQLASHAFGDSYATTSAGPGTVALQTGDYSVSGTDVNVASYNGSLSIGRTLTTLAPAAASSTASGVFGPAWTADLSGPDAGEGSLTVNDQASAGYLTLTDTDGSVSAYQAVTATSTYPVAYVGVGDAGLDGSVVTKTDATHLTDTDSDGTVTTWTGSGTSWTVSSVVEAGSNTTSSYTYNSAGLVTRILAPVPAGVDCTTPDTTAGCRSLTLAYTTVAGATRLSGVSMVAYDPASAAMTTVQVAAYDYTAGGMLADAYDPRISPALKTAYTYDATNRLATVTPPGLAAWNFSYDTAGRLSYISRYDSANTATAYTTLVYGVPITGTGAPIDMSATATAAWDQTTDLVATGTAVFGPDHQPSSTTPASIGSAEWPYASLHYLDVNGRETNTAQYGAGVWQYGATTYDGTGNMVRSLTASNRAQAVTPTTDTDSTVTAQSTSAARADLLASVTDYDPINPSEVTDSYGPVHPVVLSDGTTVHARSHTSTTYDEGSPGGATYLLPTTVVTSVQTTDGIDHDPVTTTTGYAAINSGDPTGWSLYTPTSSTTVGAAAGGGNLTTITRYNNAGQTIDTRIPGSAGGDAHSTITGYYTATGTGSCVSAALAGLVCSSGPAAQPTTGNPLPVTTYTYDLYDSPLTKIETAGSTVRTTTMTYDSAERPSTSGIAVTPAAAGGTAVPTVTDGYDSATGLPTTVATSASTLTSTYNTLGRLATYTDATGAVSTYSYDLSGHEISLNDSKATATWTYDSSTEHRGLVTSENVGGITATAGTYTASYAANGALSTLTYPGGLTANTNYNNEDWATTLTYAKSGSTWMTFGRAPDAQGRTATQSSPQSSQILGYDTAGRLLSVQDTVPGLSGAATTCTTRVYAFDADSNRTSLKTYPDDGTNTTTGHCSTATTPSTASSTFDGADRITNTGYTYDTLGRTTTAPAADSTSIANGASGAPTESYYANDMVASQAQGSTTNTYTLDPQQNRINTETAASTTTTNHYTDTSDSPEWTSTSPTTWTRNLTGPAGGLVGTQDQTGAITFQLTNLHGDTIATATSTSTAVNNYQESTEYGVPRTPSTAYPTYGYLGEAQRSSNALGGVILMGARLYNTNTGRFLTVDPIYGGNDNPYVYPSNPIDGFDLTGLDANHCVKRVCIYVRSRGGHGLDVVYIAVYLKGLGEGKDRLSGNQTLRVTSQRKGSNYVQNQFNKISPYYPGPWQDDAQGRHPYGAIIFEGSYEYPDNTQLCATVDGHPGQACINVHS